MLDDVIRDTWNGEEVDALEVYGDIFRLGEGLIQREGVESRDFKSNPIAYWKNDKDQKGHYRIMFDDTFPEILKECQEADFCIVNGITYYGRKNLQSSAGKMSSLIFDLDGVTEKGLRALWSQCVNAEILPLPNYLILSGHGVHLYYVMEDPVPLYPNIKIQTKALKYALTEKMWNMYVTNDWDKVQYQGINQGFRVIGGKTKIDGVRVRAFRIHSTPYTLTQLSQYVPEESRVDESKIWKESRMSLQEAKEKYPEWYEKRVKNKGERGHWTTKRDLYDWWIRKIREGAQLHHRYFDIMCLAIYGVKAGISEEELRKDALGLIPFLNSIAPEEPFTESDVESALECYDERYFTFPREDISKLSGIVLHANKRNGRKQEIHLQRARAVQMIDYPDGEWRNKEGRPNKIDQVRKWRSDHPEGKKIDCIRETGLSKSTVYRHWEK